MKDIDIGQEQAEKKRWLDITGERYGRLVALRRIKKKQQRGEQTAWECRCDCGRVVEVWLGNLRKGLTQSCGCLRKERIAEKRRKGERLEVGKTVGRLTMLERVEGARYERWMARCEGCGRVVMVNGYRVRVGKVQDCGCGKISTSKRNVDKLREMLVRRFGETTAQEMLEKKPDQRRTRQERAMRDMWIREIVISGQTSGAAIGELFGLSRERIRQIVGTSLRKLRKKFQKQKGGHVNHDAAGRNTARAGA